ncbi:7-cyano-7-deazaguanine synthase QueC [Croceicoccus sp. F390]|uniref:7-cyano-7-deazaguanine synthase n=1 Tax=Croceicoccus esteveae TaxID=3075597 RepID=A0ABU2ZGW1_9SPHN|nr:7-cyano-7-deazaguanine synthase QueC [Croceicoccus sp. F390]MDT0575825.1 7-cyano-7-deazaguanine synthase QueC [Croceicoccus sp. F390]
MTDSTDKDHDAAGHNGRAAVVLLSGGLDSMVSAALAAEQGFAVSALTIDYGQRNRRELQSARWIAQALGVTRHEFLSLDLGVFGGSALTDDIAVPKDGAGMTLAASPLSASGDAIPVTYVPARNLVFLSLTLAFAETLGAADIFIGVNALDYSGYPDCRPEFIRSFQETANLATRAGTGKTRFNIHAPLQMLTKAQIAAEAFRLDLDPGLSWSCYDPLANGQACGACDSCRLRRRAFAAIGKSDGLAYAS